MVLLFIINNVGVWGQETENAPLYKICGTNSQASQQPMQGSCNTDTLKYYEEQCLRYAHLEFYFVGDEGYTATGNHLNLKFKDFSKYHTYNGYDYVAELVARANYALATMQPTNLCTGWGTYSPLKYDANGDLTVPNPKFNTNFKVWTGNIAEKMPPKPNAGFRYVIDTVHFLTWEQTDSVFENDNFLGDDKIEVFLFPTFFSPNTTIPIANAYHNAGHITIRSVNSPPTNPSLLLHETGHAMGLDHTWYYTYKFGIEEAVNTIDILNVCDDYATNSKINLSTAGLITQLLDTIDRKLINKYLDADGNINYTLPEIQAMATYKGIDCQPCFKLLADIVIEKWKTAVECPYFNPKEISSPDESENRCYDNIGPAPCTVVSKEMETGPGLSSWDNFSDTNPNTNCGGTVFEKDWVNNKARQTYLKSFFTYCNDPEEITNNTMDYVDGLPLTLTCEQLTAMHNTKFMIPAPTNLLPLETPHSLVLSCNTPGSITFNWQGNQADSYQIAYHINSDTIPAYTIIDHSLLPTTPQNYTFEMAALNTTYKFTIRAINGSCSGRDTSAWSDTLTVNTPSGFVNPIGFAWANNEFNIDTCFLTSLSFYLTPNTYTSIVWRKTDAAGKTTILTAFNNQDTAQIVIDADGLLQFCVIATDTSGCTYHQHFTTNTDKEKLFLYANDCGKSTNFYLYPGDTKNDTIQICKYDLPFTIFTERTLNNKYHLDTLEAFWKINDIAMPHNIDANSDGYFDGYYDVNAACKFTYAFGLHINDILANNTLLVENDTSFNMSINLYNDTTQCHTLFNFVIIYHNIEPKVNLGPDLWLCPSAINFTAGVDTTGQPPGVTYLWNDGSSSPTKLITQAGTYILQASAADCTATDTLVVTNAQPNITFNEPDSIFDGLMALCPDTDTFTLTALCQYMPTDVTYLWSNNATTQSITITPPYPQTYNVTITPKDTSLNCPNTSTITINEAITPTIIHNKISNFKGNTLQNPINQNDIVRICKTDPEYYWFVSTTDSAEITNWVIDGIALTPKKTTGYCLTDDDNGVEGFVISFPEVKLNKNKLINQSGVHTVVITITNIYSGCQNTYNYTLYIYGTTLSLQSQPQTVCPQSPATITPTPPPPPDALLWSTADTTPTITVTQAGTYSLTVTPPLAGCPQYSSSITLTDGAPPLEITPNNGNNTISVCQANLPLTLTATSTDPNITNYLWGNGETTPTISVNQTGIYTVTITNQQGCTNTAAIAVIINNAPIITLIAQSINTCTTLITAPGLLGSYEWSVPDNDGSTPNTIEVYEPGIYTLTFTDALTGCQATTNITINDTNFYDLIDPLITTNTTWDMNSFAGGVARIKGIIKIAPNATLTIDNLTLHFADPQSGIEIDTAATLNLTNSTLSSDTCTQNYWQGIVLLGNPFLPQDTTNQPRQGILNANNSLIKNAYIGVHIGKIAFLQNNGNPLAYMRSGGVINATNTQFLNCSAGVVFEPYSFSAYSTFAVNCRFTFSKQFIGNETAMFNPDAGYIGIYTSGMRRLNLTGIIFERTGTIGSSLQYHKQGIGIVATNSHLNIGSLASNGNMAPTSESCTFTNLYKGIDIYGFGTALNAAIIDQNQFTQTRRGITLNGNGFSQIRQNTFTQIPSIETTQNSNLIYQAYGILNYGSTAFNIEGNVFSKDSLQYNATHGIITLNSGLGGGTIKRNAFEGSFWAANLLLGDNQALELDCNQYNSQNKADWLIAHALDPETGIINLANLKEQGYCDFNDPNNNAPLHEYWHAEADTTNYHILNLGIDTVVVHYEQNDPATFEPTLISGIVDATVNCEGQGLFCQSSFAQTPQGLAAIIQNQISQTGTYAANLGNALVQNYVAHGNTTAAINWQRNNPNIANNTALMAHYTLQNHADSAAHYWGLVGSNSQPQAQALHQIYSPWVAALPTNSSCLPSMQQQADTLMGSFGTMVAQQYLACFNNTLYNRQVYIPAIAEKNAPTMPTNASNTLKVYPNPTNSSFTVETPTAEGLLKIYDTKGILLLQIPVAQKQTLVATPQLTAGVYYVYWYSPNSNTLMAKIAVIK